MHLPETLITSIKSDRVIPFVGAGVSMAVRRKSGSDSLFPSWHQLLNNAAERLEKENKAEYGELVRSLLKITPAEYLTAAKYAQEGLGAIWFQFLKEQFDHPYEDALQESLELAKKIWLINSQLIITTNYDRVLKWASPKNNDLAIWDIEAPAEQVELLKQRSTRPVLWHLHGQIDNAAGLILTPDGYQKLYPSDNAETRFKAALHTFRSLIASHSLLFVGFSLEDQAIGTELKAVNEYFQGSAGPHYILIHKKKVEYFRTLKLPNIETVSFEDYQNDLTNILTEITNFKNDEGASRGTPTLNSPRTKKHAW